MAQNDEVQSFAVPDLGVSLHEDKLLLSERRCLSAARVLRWVPGIALMIFLAIGQAGFFNMSVYAQVPGYRPDLHSGLSILGL